MRKGKACVRPEAENHQTDRPLGLPSSFPPERLNRPLIRPISQEPTTTTAAAVNRPSAAVVIPPPPAKHVEREKFFQENKNDGSALGGHMRGLSLHSRNASSSRSDSFELSDWVRESDGFLWWEYILCWIWICLLLLFLLLYGSGDMWKIGTWWWRNERDRTCFISRIEMLEVVSSLFIMGSVKCWVIIFCVCFCLKREVLFYWFLFISWKDGVGWLG